MYDNVFCINLPFFKTDLHYSKYIEKYEAVSFANLDKGPNVHDRR